MSRRQRRNCGRSARYTHLTEQIATRLVDTYMKKLACLCFLVACAAKPPVAPVAPQVLFEIETNDLASGPEKNVVFTNGAWQLDKSGGGTTKGQLSATELAVIEKDAGAPWSTTPHTGITCHMMHAPTDYLANGKLVYRDTGCESPVLDDASAKALAEIVSTLSQAEAQR